jgi:ATP-dependent protease Clp ATPase subunit
MPYSEGLLSCSFCGKNQKQVIKLLSGLELADGTHRYICDECVGRAHDALTPGSSSCRFCGHDRDQVAALASAGDTRICADCLELCDVRLAEEASG